MIKICHIVNLITGETDGVYAHLKMIFQNSDKTKYQHYLIFQGGEKIENELSEIEVKNFVSTSLKKKISIRAFVDIHKILKANEIDIIHTHLIKPYSIAGLVNIIIRRKFVFNYHGLFIKKNPYYNIFESCIYSAIHFLIFLFGKVDVVLVPSKRSKELLLNETKLFPEPVVYYNGFSNSKVAQQVNDDVLNKIQKIKNSKFIIALIGRLEIDKRVDNAIQIIKQVTQQNSNARFLIFGEGSLNNDLQNLVNKLELNDFVQFFGYVHGLNNYYKYFDILLFTSDWEGMPLSMWEGMANRVPIVAPDVGGFREILEENNCGLIYEPGNLDDAEEKIVQLINNEQLRVKLRQNGKTLIEEKYNEKEFISQIERIYFRLMSQ